MSCNFRVGQKVVCINNGDIEELGLDIAGIEIVGDLDGLQKGVIYTVREVFFCEIWEEYHVKLSEIYRSNYVDSYCHHYEPGYSPLRFRPLVEKKTDISIFTAMLTKKNLKVDA